jgi:hypothetical protein
MLVAERQTYPFAQFMIQPVNISLAMLLTFFRSGRGSDLMHGRRPADCGSRLGSTMAPSAITYLEIF